MNYFKTIKAALDSSFAGICHHMKIKAEDAYELIRRHLATMSREWFTGETPNIVYSDPLCRFAYLYCHTAAILHAANIGTESKTWKLCVRKESISPLCF